MQYNLQKLLGSFLTEGTFLTGEPFGNGHIHETFLIKTCEKDKDDYILQRINNRVFTNVPGLQENIERITAHLEKKISSVHGSESERQYLRLIHTNNGYSWTTDTNGYHWRMFVFIPDHKSYEIVDSSEKAYEAGKAIGKFQALLTDLPGKPLFETIPDFHNLEKRLDNFRIALKNDSVGRNKMTEEEKRNIIQRSDEMTRLHRLGTEGRIPERIVHNDTKINNILFDKDDKSLCVIDLDTVMPGYFYYDFGDAIRTATNTAEEDEKDLSKIRIDINLFEGYAKGYLSETEMTLNNVEKENLALAPLVMTYEQALRFLTDYLNGDIYYKTEHEHHNLQRTRAQIKLMKTMEEQYDNMKRIIKKIL